MSISSYANDPRFIVNLGLSRIRALLSLLGDPQDKIKVIHVAGTNGKGSVCAFLLSILRQAGLKTGLFSSPELVNVNERISIGGVNISDAALNSLFERIENAIKKLPEKPSPFEIWTAAAYLYFYEQKCDYAIVEVGLGGLEDATNVISKPALSIITRISIDHTDYLGETVSEIAFHKCGIIKEGCPIVTIEQDKSAMEVIRHTALKTSAPLFTAPLFHSTPDGMMEKLLTDIGPAISALPGLNQAENASVAITAAKLLRIDKEHIISGIEHASHKGRFEVLSSEPFIIFDGAHNEGGAKALSDNLSRYFPGEKFVFIFAAMRDKAISDMLKTLSPHAESFIFTTVSGNPRAATCDELCAAAKCLDLDCDYDADLSGAIKKALLISKRVIIAGSLYLYKNLPVFDK